MERFEILLDKFYNRRLPEEEKVEFEGFLESSEECRTVFHDLNFVRSSLDAMQMDRDIEVPDLRGDQSKKIFNLHRVLVHAAAILTIPLLIGILFLKFSPEKELPARYTQISCPGGKVTLVTLTDGSIVRLYAGSTLKYPDRFDAKERIVELKGEASFEVVSDPKHPFYVETIDGVKVKAYGTKFNVCGYENESRVFVYLQNGVIDFSSPCLQKPVVLEPETQLIYQRSNKEITLQKQKPDEYIAHEQGWLLFRKTPLEEIALKLTRMFHTEIVLEGEDTGEYIFTGIFKEESLPEILDRLTLALSPLEWHREGKNIVITKNSLMN